MPEIELIEEELEMHCLDNFFRFKTPETKEYNIKKSRIHNNESEDTQAELINLTKPIKTYARARRNNILMPTL